MTGRRYPLGIQTFEKIREGGYTYVDKTRYIYKMAHQFQYAFLSRPRRFGKSLLVSTLKSYFEGRRDLFEGLAISGLEQEWTQHPVIHISLASAKGDLNLVRMRINTQLEWMEKSLGIKLKGDSPGDRLINLVKGSVEKYGQQAVVLIDEYDAPLLGVMHQPEQLEAVRQELRAFYSPLKDLDPWLRFAFITGISKFSQLSIFSELNNLKRMTMMPQYSAICGITDEELHTQWHWAVEDMAGKMGRTTDETYAMLKRRYDGYHFAKDMTDVYNPYSLLNAFDDGDLSDQWFDSGTPTVLIKMLQKFGTDITKLDGATATSLEFDAPTEKMQSVLPLFYQSGYITIKDYDPVMDEYTLGYPNQEVLRGMMEALAPYYVWDDVNTTNNNIREIYRAIYHGDLPAAFNRLKVFLSTVPYAEGATTEGHFQSLLYVVFALMGRYMQVQVRTATGRIDCVWQSPTDVYVIELKMDKPATEALQQIDQKGYLVPYSLDGRRLHKVGLSFSTKTRTIEEWEIED